MNYGVENVKSSCKFKKRVLTNFVNGDPTLTPCKNIDAGLAPTTELQI
jgi:hypothetical protein